MWDCFLGLGLNAEVSFEIHRFRKHGTSSFGAGTNLILILYWVVTDAMDQTSDRDPPGERIKCTLGALEGY